MKILVKKTHLNIFIITFIYLLVILYMLPLRNQTYNDDWHYIQSVRYFLNTGKLKVSDYSFASAIVQIIWGIIFSKLFSFSFKNLHVANLLVFYPGLICFYLTLVRFTKSQIRSLLFTLFLMSYPWVMQLLFTFQTDTTYISMMLVSVFLFTKGFQENSNKYFLLGSLLSGLAFLTRQLGILIVISVLATLFLHQTFTKHFPIRCFLYTLVPAAFLVGIYSRWLAIPGNLTVVQEQQGVSAVEDRIPYLLFVKPGSISITDFYYYQIFYRVIFYFSNSVGFLLPIFLIFKINYRKIASFIRKFKVPVIILSAASVGLILFLVVYHYVAPYFDLIIIPTFITAYSTLYESSINTLWKFSVILSIFIWIPLIAASLSKLFFFVTVKKNINLKIFLIFMFLGVVSLVFYSKTYIFAYFIYVIFLLLLLLFANRKITRFSKQLPPEVTFMVLSFLFHFLSLIFIAYNHWSQYVLSLIPFILIWLAAISDKWKISKTFCFLILLFLFTFSLNVTKNRYESNGLNFELASKAVLAGIPPVDIMPHDQSWLPWWYFEGTLKVAVQKAGGNKYKINPFRPWSELEDHQPTYGILYVPLNFKYSDEPHRQIIEDSGIQNWDLFTKVRRVVFKNI